MARCMAASILIAATPFHAPCCSSPPRATARFDNPAQDMLNVACEPIGLIGVCTGPELCITFPNGDRIQAVTAFFRSRIVSGEPTPDGVEVCEARFFGRSELPSEPGWMELLRQYLFA